MSKKRRICCPHCGFLQTKHNGHYRGFQRYYCSLCNSYFLDRRPHISTHNKLVWFRDWIIGKQSIEQLSERSSYSVRHLKSYFHSLLPICPVRHIQRREKVNLLIDGTYFPNKACLVFYRDTNIRMTLFYRLTDGERLHELREDLQNIKNTGIEIESVTCNDAPCISPARRNYG